LIDFGSTGSKCCTDGSALFAVHSTRMLFSKP
jgi:hypothetical protein